MSWGVFILALLATSVLQAGVVDVLAPELFGHAFLNLYLVLALTVGLRAPRDDARLAALLTGLLADLAGSGAFGIHTFALGLAAFLVTMWRDALRTQMWAARVILAFFAAIPAELLVSLHVRFWQLPPGPFSAGQMTAGAIMTATVAALIAATITEFPQFKDRRRLGRRFSMRP